MTTLIGSEKQILWANDLRAFATEVIEYTLNNTELNEKDIQRVSGIKFDMQNTDAKFWIENFKPAGSSKIEAIVNYIAESTKSNRTTSKLCATLRIQYDK
jgi:site-specific DNA-cytosine methylase